MLIPNIEQIYETNASAEVAAIYNDIKVTMQMSFVNLIWRRLAVSPEGLRWTWESMKPLYTSGIAHHEADALRTGQSLPNVPRLPNSALRAVGIDNAAEGGIRAALAGYDRGNPLNTVAFSAILAKLDPTVNIPLRNDILSDVHPAKQGSIPPAPSLMSFDEMDTMTSELAHAVTQIGARGEGLRVQVSLPRNLAHWPGFLSLYLTALQPLHDNGRLFSAVDEVLSEGLRRGTMLAAYLDDHPAPSAEVTQFVADTLNTLVPHAMGRMIPVVSLLSEMMPLEQTVIT